MGTGGSGMRGGGKGGGGVNVNVGNATDIWSYRHNPKNTEFGNSVNSAMQTINDDFPGFTEGVNTVDAVEIKGRGKNTVLGYWDSQQKQLGMNTNFTDANTMNSAMDQAASAGYHPSRGSKSGTEAVTLHEGGHALTDHLAAKNGYSGLHEFSEHVVKDAYRNSGAKGGVHRFAGSVSKYAQTNYAETVAEAVADWYCNGSKASSASKAIMTELRRYR